MLDFNYCWAINYRFCVFGCPVLIDVCFDSMV